MARSEVVNDNDFPVVISPLFGNLVSADLDTVPVEKAFDRLRLMLFDAWRD